MECLPWIGNLSTLLGEEATTGTLGRFKCLGEFADGKPPAWSLALVLKNLASLRTLLSLLELSVIVSGKSYDASKHLTR